MPFDTIPLALLCRFASTALAHFLAVAVTWSCFALAAAMVEAPGLDWHAAALLGLDSLLASADLIATAVITSASLVTLGEAASQQLLLQAWMAGRAPIANLGPIATAVAGCCLALHWHAHCAQPEAGYRVRYPAESVLHAVGFLGTNRIQLSGSGMRLHGSKASATTATDVCMTMRDADEAQLLVASKTSVLDAEGTQPAQGRTTIQCADGCLVLAAQGRSPMRVQFATLEWEAALASLVRPDKQSLLPLHHYASYELDRYGEQVEVSARSGIQVQDAEIARARAVVLIRWLRTTSAWQPMFALLLVALLLRRSAHRAFALGDIAWVAIAIAAGLLLRIGLEARAAKLGTITSPWWALAPTSLTIVLGSKSFSRGSRP